MVVGRWGILSQIADQKEKEKGIVHPRQKGKAEQQSKEHATIVENKVIEQQRKRGNRRGCCGGSSEGAVREQGRKLGSCGGSIGGSSRIKTEEAEPKQ